MNELPFIQTERFAKWVRKSRLNGPVAKLYRKLAARREAGDVIPGGGGLRN